MHRTLAARVCFAFTAACVLAALVLQLYVAVTVSDPLFQSVPNRIFNVFCYFTTQSNIIVGVTCAILALNPDANSKWFRAFRVAGLVDIVITAVVFYVALKGLQDLEGAAVYADFLVHTMVPALAVVGWILFGPRRQFSTDDIGLALVAPVAWLVLMFTRGAITDFYPYPFVDVAKHGYLKVAVNVAFISAFFFGIAFGAQALDRVLIKKEFWRA